MRVVFLSPSGQIGGAESCLLDMIAAIRRAHADYEILVIAGEDGPLHRKAEELGATVQVLPFPPSLARAGESGESGRFRLLLSLLRNIPAAFAYRTALRAVLKRIQPDLVHTNGFKMHVFGALAKPASSKLVWHAHDYLSSRRVSAHLLRALKGRADAVIAVSQSVAGDAKQTIGHHNVITILNAIDLDEFSPEGDRLDLDGLSGMPAAPPGCIRIGLMATMAWWKGHRLFLEAVAKLGRNLPIRAYVIGGAVYQTGSRQESVEALRAFADRLGISDRVAFTGFVDDPAAAIRALDIVIHASTEPEPFGRVIVEAMACGKTVVSSAEGGSREILSAGEIGKTFQSGDAASLAQVIATLVQDPGTRASLSSNALHTARTHFDRMRLGHELPRVYESLIGRPRLNDRLRVLHLQSGNMIGGIESALQTLAEFAPACPEMQQEFALAFDSDFAGRLRQSGSVVHVLPEVQLRNPASVIRSRRALLRLLRSQHFDAVISHSPWCQVVYAPSVRANGTPLLFWMHGAFDGHWLQRLAARHSPDLAICNSLYTQSTLARVYPKVRSEIVRYPVPQKNGIGTSTENLRRELETEANAVVILMASRMEAWKGHFNLLHAAAGLRTKTEWVLWIAGGPQTAAENAYAESVKTEAAKCGLRSKIRLLGQRKDVADLMRAADVFCQPNAGPEPFGVVFVEALQAGVPVVTFSMGGPQEILDEHCGILVPPGDNRALTAALARLIDDQQLRRTMGKAGPARARLLCDPPTQIRRVNELVRSLVQKPAPMAKGTSA